MNQEQEYEAGRELRQLLIVDDELAMRQRTARLLDEALGRPEEALRYDAAHTTVPPEIARRLQKSTGQTGAPPRPWWKSLLGI